jgi:spermidine synthase
MSSLRVVSSNMKKLPRLEFLLLIFFVSGVSGLIYESLWSHYLKLFLGHAAYAQTLVLVLFMGGMAAGAWLVSKFADKVDNPIRTYAAVDWRIRALVSYTFLLWLDFLFRRHITRTRFAFCYKFD